MSPNQATAEAARLALANRQDPEQTTLAAGIVLMDAALLHLAALKSCCSVARHEAIVRSDVEWEGLKLRAVQEICPDPDAEGDDWFLEYRLELRDCACCGSTLARELHALDKIVLAFVISCCTISGS